MEKNIPQLKSVEEDAAKQQRHNGNVVRLRWRRIAAVGGGGILVLAIVTLVFFLAHPPQSSIAVTPSPGSSQHGLSSFAHAALTPEPALPLQPLPCTVNLRTWTDGASDWQTHNSVLLNTGKKGWNASGGPSIIAPCDVSSASAWSSTNIAVETTMRVTGARDNACFGITIRGNPTIDGWQGYKAGVGNCLGELDGARVTGPDYAHDAQAKEIAFHPGTGMHTYRVEIEDTSIRFYVDRRLALNVYDTRYLTGSEIGLWSQNTQLVVTSFKVTSLAGDNN